MVAGVLLQSFLLVFLAEMGDKSQFLLIALSKRYRMRELIFGSALAILFLNLLAALLGGAMGEYVPSKWISVCAGIAFLYFAVSTLREGKTPEKTHDVCGKRAVVSVFCTYFLAELGDKTQLTAFTLSANEAHSASGIASVAFGASLGLLFSGGVAVFFGELLGRYLPERLFQRLSAMLFFACGIVRIMEGLEEILKDAEHPVLYAALPISVFAVGCLILICKEGGRYGKKYAGSAQSVSKQ